MKYIYKGEEVKAYKYEGNVIQKCLKGETPKWLRKVLTRPAIISYILPTVNRNDYILLFCGSKAVSIISEEMFEAECTKVINKGAVRGQLYRVSNKCEYSSLHNNKLVIALDCSHVPYCCTLKQFERVGEEVYTKRWMSLNATVISTQHLKKV